MTLATHPDVEFPDAELVAITYLNGLLDEPVFTFVPNATSSETPTAFVVVQRTGGTRDNALVDVAQLTFDTYGRDSQAAFALAQQVRRHINLMPDHLVDGVKVDGTSEVGGPTNLPDPRSNQPRYTQTHLIRLRGVSPAAGS